MTKTSSKLLAIIALITIIIVISILRSCLSANRERTRNQLNQAQDGHISSNPANRNSGDSTEFYLDSIRTLESFYRSQIARILIERRSDSTRLYSDSVRKLENLYRSRLESLEVAHEPNPAADTSPSPGKDPNSLLVERMTVEYDSLLGALPPGLAIREMEIARAQVCFQMAQKYNISPDSLQRIIQSRH